MDILALIPARGGSKGVPRKNISNVAGKPLIQYSIETANEAIQKGLLTMAIVSTDDREIADVSKSVGGRVPFLRPTHLATDEAKSIDVILHAIEYYSHQGQSFDAVLLLQPTCPIRTVEDIERVIKLYETTGQPSVISVYKEEYICDLVTYHKKGDLAVPLNENHNKGIRRQELDKLYVRNGTFYLTSTEYLLEQKRIISDTPALYEMSKTDSINIDTEEDLEFLRWKLSK